MADESANLIEFHFPPGDQSPAPYPAAKAVPDWLKTMPADVPDTAPHVKVTGTVKRCAPFVEAMSCGYVIPLACDVKFFLRDAEHLDYEQELPIILSHPPNQYSGAPFAKRLLVKFINLWIIKTPPGYSTLFLPLLNQFTFPFQILAGLVETDTFYRPVYFPSFCTMEPGQRCVLKKGTPLVQAIPIKREAWQSKVELGTPALSESLLARQQENPHLYKDEFWQKKDFR